MLLSQASTEHAKEFIAGHVVAGLAAICTCLIAYVGSTVHVIGFIVIGLSLVCFSISSKVILLAKLWWKKFPLACCFLASFMVELATTTPDFFIPARALMGVGAVCFTLFSIVSILESGAS